MKIGFNEGCNRFCENHSVLEDLDLCEKYGFDYIDIQSECLDREIAAGKYTIDDLGAWFADPKHHLSRPRRRRTPLWQSWIRSSQTATSWAAR